MSLERQIEVSVCLGNIFQLFTEPYTLSSDKTISIC